jgi:hypothetical protein
MKTIDKVKWIFLGILLVSLSVHAKREHSETWYQTKWCQEQGGEMEVSLPDRTRCDCVTRGYAVEVEFGNRWHQAIGQCLHYALQTNKRAGILLILESRKERKYWKKLNRVIKTFRLPIDVWTTGDGADFDIMFTPAIH